MIQKSKMKYKVSELKDISKVSQTKSRFPNFNGMVWGVAACDNLRSHTVVMTPYFTHPLWMYSTRLGHGMGKTMIGRLLLIPRVSRHLGTESFVSEEKGSSDNTSKLGQSWTNLRKNHVHPFFKSQHKFLPWHESCESSKGDEWMNLLCATCTQEQ